MVYMNASKKSRHVSSLVNQNQGGGDKKAGFPYLIGRGSWTSIHFNNVNPYYGHCCQLGSYNINMMPNASISRPIGRVNNVPYWHIQGT